DRERLGEILGRVRLRVPLTEVVYVTAASGARLITRRVLQRRRTKHLAPALTPPQPIGVVECVPGFVAQDAHEGPGTGSFGFAHDAAFEAFEAGMRKVERHRDARDAIRREPFLRQPHMRLEMDAAALELRIEPRDPALEPGLLE